jgi:O-antigen ligase
MLLKVLLFVQLLHVVNQVHFPWETGIPGIAPTNIVFLLVLLAMRGKPEPVTAKPILQNALLYFYAALTFAFLWAQIRSPGDFLDDATYLKNALFFPLFYFLFYKCKQDEKTTRQLIIWVLVIAAVAGLEAIREGFDYGFGKYNPFRRASGPFGVDWHNANRAGVFYGMFMPMFVALALFLKQRKLWRLAAVGGCVLLAGGALFTYSRQSYFLVVLAFALLLVRKSVVLSVIISVTLVSLAGYLPDSVFQRVEETKQQDKKGGGEEVDASTSSRWEIWAGALEMTKNNPIGVGLNRFKKEIGSYSSHKKMDAHNFYVLTMAECGPQGLFTLLFLIWTCFKLAAFLRRNADPDDPELRALTLGYTVSVLCMALGGIYGSPTLEGAVMAPFWAMSGLLERYVHLKLQGAQRAPVEENAEASLAQRFPLAAHILPGRRG